MEYKPSELLTIQAKLAMPIASVELHRINLPGAIEACLPAADEYRIDLSLTPRTPDARLSYSHWPAHRFEAPGRVYLVPPGEAVRARSSGGVQDAVICLLHPSNIDQWLDGEVVWTRQRFEASLDVQSGVIRRLMIRMGEEVRHPGFASATLCEDLSVQIAIELARYYLAFEDRASATTLPAWRLRLIDERLEEVHMPPTLTELAELCGISVRHLTRGFRGSRGCSIGEYIQNRRIDIAKRLLLQGESVKRIAHSMGFASRSSFSHAFQKATGQAPQQYRQMQSATGYNRLN